jgi:MoxR-like ATPase
MAVDFRVPADATNRAWLEKALLEMESKGLIDVTREKSPAHYHIAVFAEPFLAYAAQLDAAADSVRENARRAAVARALAFVSSEDVAAPDSRRAPVLLAGLSLLAVAIPVTRRMRNRA